MPEIAYTQKVVHHLGVPSDSEPSKAALVGSKPFKQSVPIFFLLFYDYKISLRELCHLDLVGVGSKKKGRVRR